MRCPDCNKFVPYSGDEEPEVESVDLDVDSGTVTAEVRLHKDCAECGMELKEITFSLEGDVPKEFYDEHHDDGKGKHLLEADEETVEQTERTDNPGRPARYQRHYYGVSLEVVITCSCGETCSVTLTDDAPASALDECC